MAGNGKDEVVEKRKHDDNNNNNNNNNAKKPKDGKQEKNEHEPQGGVITKGRWKINTDLAYCIRYNRAIVEHGDGRNYWVHQFGGTNDVFWLNPTNENSTLLVAKVNGFFWGQFVNACEVSQGRGNARQQAFAKALSRLTLYTHTYGGGANNHAEDAFLESFDAAEKAGVVDKLRELYGGALFVTLKITRTPCQYCAPKLQDFVQKHKNLKLRIKAQTFYEGDGGGNLNAKNLVSMISGSSIGVRIWDVPLHFQKHAQKGKVTQRITKLGQTHELACWCSDGDDQTQIDILEAIKGLMKGSEGIEGKKDRFNRFMNNRDKNNNEKDKNNKDKNDVDQDYWIKTGEVLYRTQKLKLDGKPITPTAAQVREKLGML